MIPIVELASVVILALAGVVEWRAGRGRAFMRDSTAIAIAAWLAEELSIRAFGFYSYSPGWTLMLDRVPAMVALIWPFVILSARALARKLVPNHVIALATAIVIFDALLIEPVAVRANLWSWREPGIFGVTPIGPFGWGAMALASLVLLERNLRIAIPLVAPLAANLLCVAMWWTLFRWLPRGELGPALRLALALIPALVALWLLRDRRAQVALEVMGPRAAAAMLFFALIAASGDGALAIYACAFAAPYLWLTSTGRARPAADRPTDR